MSRLVRAILPARRVRVIGRTARAPLPSLSATCARGEPGSSAPPEMLEEWETCCVMMVYTFLTPKRTEFNTCDNTRHTGGPPKFRVRTLAPLALSLENHSTSI
ncbi:hypothetical protein EYF80_021365 [Liparis tanakae]|uniref:Uncharacterized protein n=1 Tax=Liparis tanakae TaxID=230148 RepID=A0A4Z2HTW9_9TELE|nr:hypothetical protein EYF80_021365 [Liparis tanakae]